MLALVPLVAAPARAQQVIVERSLARGDSVELVLRMDLAATPATVWQVLTDYDGMERFVPGVERSRRLRRTREGPLVEQAGVAATLPGRPRVWAVLQMRERAPSLLVFRATAGTFPRLHGFWLLRPLRGGRTRLFYRSTVGGVSLPRAGPLEVPDAVLGWIVRQELTPRVRAIGREAERRAVRRG